MLKRFSRAFVAFALCCSIGGHWFGLQSIAWANMVVSYSQHCSFVKAVAKTFDGAHPCDLCKRISKAKDTEKKQDNQRSTSKADLICVVRQFALLPPFVPVDYSELASSLVRGSQQPPSPPPRTELT
jgi:hypothetical protein